jgi:hypothetical protein
MDLFNYITVQTILGEELMVLIREDPELMAAIKNRAAEVVKLLRKNYSVKLLIRCDHCTSADHEQADCPQISNQ